MDGQLEVMLHRRTLRSDDGNTVEALNETDSILNDGTRIGKGLVVTGRFLLAITAPSQAAMTARTGHLEQYAPVIPFFTPIPSIAAYMTSHVSQWSYLSAPLPPQLDLHHNAVTRWWACDVPFGPHLRGGRGRSAQ